MTNLVSPWESIQVGPVSPGMLVARSRKVLAFFESSGIRVPGGNRLERALKRIEDSNDPSRFDELTDEELFSLAEAMKTAWDAFLVTHTWKSRPRRKNPFPNDRLSCFMEGADLPEADSSAKPRSTQFELFVTAQLVLGGADVRAVEPDLTFLYHGEYVGVAAKRVTRRRRETAANQIRKARHQLRDNQVRGFIALNLDVWSDELHLVPEPEAYGRRFNEQLAEVHEELAKTPEEHFVLGALIFNHSIGWERGENGVLSLRWSEGSQYMRFSEEPAEVERANAFFGPLSERMWSGLREAAAFIAPRE